METMSSAAAENKTESNVEPIQGILNSQPKNFVRFFLSLLKIIYSKVGIFRIFRRLESKRKSNEHILNILISYRYHVSRKLI